MKSKNSKEKKRKPRQQDEQLDDWLEKTDLSSTIKKGKVVAGRRGRPPVGSKISITLPDDLIAELKKAAEKRAIGYQTLIRMIVKENIKNYG